MSSTQAFKEPIASSEKGIGDGRWENGGGSSSSSSNNNNNRNSNNGSGDGHTTQQQQISSNEVVSMHHVHRKRFSYLAIVGMAFAILNSPTAASASLSVVIVSGGPVAAIWGMLISAVGVLCIAASMAEICSVLPTPGGPYHFAFKLASSSHGGKWQIAIAYATGWLAAAGWVCLTATTSSLAGSLIVGIIALLHPNYEQEAWHEFLIYIAFAIGAWFINVFGARTLDGVNRTALLWSVVGVVVICITTLACASPNYQSGKFVFATFVNQTGWNDGVAFILGLLQSTFSLVGTDGATHMIDEMPNPEIYAPAAMIIAPIIGSLTAFIILLVFLFVLRDFEQVASGDAGPLLEIIYQALGNRGGAVALYMFPVCSMGFAAISILCASSRQTQAFARDRGIPFGPFFSHEHRKLGVPIAAITLTSVWVIIFGLIYLGSSSALNAILSSSVVMLQWSYCVPVILLLIRGRSILDTIAEEEEANTLARKTTGPTMQNSNGVGEEANGRQAHTVKRRYNLGKWGYAINLWGVLFAIFTSVFFLFPPSVPTTGSTANYAAAVVFLVIVMATLSWLFDGRKHYVGPRDLDAALARARDARVES